MQISTFANGAGQWRAEVTFEHTLSESDPRTEFNLGAQWATIRRRARQAIVRAIPEREQKTHESYAEARGRVNASLGRLQVIEQSIDSLGRWHGITLGECEKVTV